MLNSNDDKLNEQTPGDSDDNAEDAKSMDEHGTGDDAGLEPRTVLALFGTLAVVAVLAIAVLSDRGNGGDNTAPTPSGNQAIEPTADSNGVGGNNGDVELGSLSVAGYACPEASSPDTDCLEAGTVEITNAMFVLEDGTQVGMDGATTMPDGNLAWLNLPIGTYQLPAESISGPDDMSVRNVIGAVTPLEGGWEVANLDPNQPAVVQILFVPESGSPAAG